MSETFEVDFNWNLWQMTIYKKDNPDIKILIDNFNEVDILVNQLTNLESEFYEKIKDAKTEYHKKHDELVQKKFEEKLSND